MTLNMTEISKALDEELTQQISPEKEEGAGEDKSTPEAEDNTPEPKQKGDEGDQKIEPDADEADEPAGDESDEAEGEGDEGEDKKPAADKKDSKSEGADQSDDTASTEGEGDSTEGDEGQPKSAAYPTHWNNQERAVFDTLDPVVQNIIVDKEKKAEQLVAKSNAELEQQRKQTRPLMEQVEKWNPALQQWGISADNAFNVLAGAYYQLKSGTPEQRLTVLRQLAVDSGIPLQAIVGGQEGQQTNDANPEVLALRNEVATLKQQLGGVQQNTQQQQDAEAANQIKAFAEARDDSGNLRHPHFESVKAQMGKLLGSGSADTMEAAYAMALSGRPELVQNDADAKKREAEQAEFLKKTEAAKKAKRATSVNTKTTKAPTQRPTKKMSLEEELSYRMSA